MELEPFIGLTEEKEADSKIEDLTRRITNAKAQAAIAARPGLRALTLPSADLDAFVAVLHRSFKHIQDDAEVTVRAHLKSHGGTPAERWLSEGQAFHIDASCPFCGQDTKGLQLLDAYRTFFNDEYNGHVHRVSGLLETASQVLPEATILAWEAQCGANTDRAQAWVQQLQLQCAHPDFVVLRELAERARVSLQAAALKKVQAPLEAMDASAIADARACCGEVVRLLSEYNGAVEGVNAQIAAFKRNLAAENLADLERGLTRVRLQKTRFIPQVVAFVTERKTQDEERRRCEQAKGKAREYRFGPRTAAGNSAGWHRIPAGCRRSNC